jgi:uncharacterized protein YebE (UPF0316 family)
MNWDVVLTCLVIIIARIADVSLGTLRTVFIVQGRRYTSWIIGFVEILIWVIVVSKVVEDMAENWVYAFSYATGFAIGTFVGMTIEHHLAVGEQVVRVFTRQGRKLATIVRTAGYGVTLFDGEGKDGPIQLLFIKIPRRKVPRLKVWLEDLDPQCYLIVDDVRFAGPLQPTSQVPTGWRAKAKKK